MRLELEALKKAVQSSVTKEEMVHIRNALTFRKYRHSLFPGADSTENLLELNEGLAEYTGAIISGRNKKQTVVHFEKSIREFFSNPTFVRSFAYQTIPVYGYLLYSTKKNWNKNISIKTNLTDYFIEAFNVSIPYDLQNTVETISNQYNGQIIIAEETEREERTKQIIAEYKSKFIEQPHMEIHLEQMNISFNPGNIIPHRRYWNSISEYESNR